MEPNSTEDELSWLKKPRPGEGLVPEAQEVAVRDPDRGPEVGRGPVVAATKEDGPNPGAEADRLHLKIGLVPEAGQDPGENSTLKYLW